MKFPVLTILLGFCLSIQAAEELRFAKSFTDHGVLQREMPVPIWGWAQPNAEVTVGFLAKAKPPPQVNAVNGSCGWITARKLLFQPQRPDTSHRPG